MLFFLNISKTAETILIKKIQRNHGVSVYKIKFTSEHAFAPPVPIMKENAQKRLRIDLNLTLT